MLTESPQEPEQSNRGDKSLQEKLGTWIEGVIGEPLLNPRDLIESLRSGVVLCKYVVPAFDKLINS